MTKNHKQAARMTRPKSQLVGSLFAQKVLEKNRNVSFHDQLPFVNR